GNTLYCSSCISTNGHIMCGCCRSTQALTSRCTKSHVETARYVLPCTTTLCDVIATYHVSTGAIAHGRIGATLYIAPRASTNTDVILTRYRMPSLVSHPHIMQPRDRPSCSITHADVPLPCRMRARFVT